MQTRAVKKNGEWVINGRKQFISNMTTTPACSWCMPTPIRPSVCCKARLVLVPRDMPGLTIARCNETLGCRFMNNGELVFEDMRVPADHLLAENDALGRAGVYSGLERSSRRQKSRRRRARLRGHRGLRAELRAGRADSDQASGGGAAALPTWRHASSDAGAVGAPRARSTRTRETPRRSATWQNCSRPRKS